jgi:hypothetical protein
LTTPLQPGSGSPGKTEAACSIRPLPIEIESWKDIPQHAWSTNPGEQHLYRFANGYGASVVRGPYTYGGREGLYELGVVRCLDDDTWSLTYDTPITDDVLGYLTLTEVADLLIRIAALPDGGEESDAAAAW